MFALLYYPNANISYQIFNNLNLLMHDCATQVSATTQYWFRTLILWSKILRKIIHWFWTTKANFQSTFEELNYKWHTAEYHLHEESNRNNIAISTQNDDS